jgi:hypothetical protein
VRAADGMDGRKREGRGSSLAGAEAMSLEDLDCRLGSRNGFGEGMTGTIATVSSTHPLFELFVLSD